jgi:tetratricopeptide (TPR) repeat protein
LQWADHALLAFIEYLLEWASSQRLYVLALARPELAEHHPEFGLRVRNSTNLALQPLSDAEVTALLDGYVPGLPEHLRRQVLARAQGVPLYAVETVRMLLDRGLLAQDGPVYRPTGEIESLEIPESLHALAASRLDGLAAEERRLVQEACVLGKSFGKPMLAALTGRSEAELEPLLAGLVRKEVLSLQADPRQPERGQYGFLQELLRQVAYETLSRRDRRARHLAAAAALEETVLGANVDVPEVIASHLLAAAEALPHDPDAGEIRQRARAALVQAGERAAALAAPDEGQHYFDQAAALSADEPRLQAELLVRAGTLAHQAGRTSDARQRLERAIGVYTGQGDTLAAARAGVTLADVDLVEGKIDEASHRLDAALPALEQAGASEELAATLGQRGRMQVFSGDVEAGAATLERALDLAEVHGLVETLVQTLVSKATVLTFNGRLFEARLLMEGAVARAHAHQLQVAWSRAAHNLAALLEDVEEYSDQMALASEIEAHASQRGDREQLLAARLGAIPALIELGRWKEAIARAREADEIEASPWAHSDAMSVVHALCEQGRLDAARTVLSKQEALRMTESLEFTAGFAAAEARLLRAEGGAAEALTVAERGLANRRELGFVNRRIRSCLVEALEAALEQGELTKADEWLAIIDDLRPGELTPSVAAHRARFHAHLAARRGDHDSAERDYRTAGKTFSEHGLASITPSSSLSTAYGWRPRVARPTRGRCSPRRAKHLSGSRPSRGWSGSMP